MDTLVLLRMDAAAFAQLRAAIAAFEPDWRCWLARGEDLVHVYAAPELLRSLPRQAAQAIEVLRLQTLSSLDGAAAAMPPRAHYVVQTDVVAEHEAEFNDWYDREHLPGLAAVAGTVRAARYRLTGPGVRYYAAYDVVDAAVVGSPAWLAARDTAWSARVFPHFRNTRRAMFEPLPRPAG